tara:strand:+ start:111 stop:338 length:228 start_codon:yes stop_codon:yes gene_type:complete
MLHSTDSLQTLVSGPLLDCFGPKTKVLTVEDHDIEVRGIALCPGKVVKYVYKVQTQELNTFDLLSIKKKRTRLAN